MTPRETGEQVESMESLAAIVRIIPTLDDLCASQLQQLLRRHIGLPTPALARESRLGLLLDVLEAHPHSLPTREAYNAERDRRAKQGQDWPEASTLAGHYGGWTQVCAQAQRLAADGTSSRVPRSNKHGGYTPPYSRTDVITAIEIAKRELGRWPSPWEYEEWAQYRRDRARLHGTDNPRLPGPKQIRKALGSFEKARNAAQDAEDRRARAQPQLRRERPEHPGGTRRT